MPSSRRSSGPRDQTHVSYISTLAGRFFTASATQEAQQALSKLRNKNSFHRTQQLEGAHKQSGLVPSLSKQENRHLTKPVALPGPPARQRLKVAADVVQREGGSNPGRSRSLQSTVTGDPSFTLTVCFCFQFSESVYKFQLSPLRGLSWGLGGRHPLPTLHTVQGTRAGLGCSELDM